MSKVDKMTGNLPYQSEHTHLSAKSIWNKPNSIQLKLNVSNRSHVNAPQ